MSIFSFVNNQNSVWVHIKLFINIFVSHSFHILESFWNYNLTNTSVLMFLLFPFKNIFCDFETDFLLEKIKFCYVCQKYLLKPLIVLPLQDGSFLLVYFQFKGHILQSSTTTYYNQLLTVSRDKFWSSQETICVLRITLVFSIQKAKTF